ncbi:hypothetical protein H5410_000529 [Solanum commersonii]|uniref:Uncharacterized protein n=1 Tax=Solanum commersonii TaxID=4109 RepID=A0A9J6AWH2_SOLCO|nr:hypothetical protein H5410_000529 [Solanum commersonii]
MSSPEKLKTRKFLPSPEFAVRRSLVRAAGAAARCKSSSQELRERRRERKRLAGRSWSSRCFWPAQPSISAGNTRERERRRRENEGAIPLITILRENFELSTKR